MHKKRMEAARAKGTVMNSLRPIAAIATKPIVLSIFADPLRIMHDIVCSGIGGMLPTFNGQ